jgi:aspartyl-tRNA(Asn)/glutamyl-tRNA(Gln) amidotransferase subunit C
MAEINQELLDHLAKLSRLKLVEEEKERLLGDLEKILNHFKELESIDTDNIPPMTGGAQLRNVFRNDDVRENLGEEKEKEKENIKKSFPDKDGDFLKVPPVFTSEGGFVSGEE